MSTDWCSVRVEFTVPAALLGEPGAGDRLLLAVRDAVHAQPYGDSVQHLRVSLHDLPDF